MTSLFSLNWKQKIKLFAVKYLVYLLEMEPFNSHKTRQNINGGNIFQPYCAFKSKCSDFFLQSV